MALKFLKKMLECLGLYILILVNKMIQNTSMNLLK